MRFYSRVADPEFVPYLIVFKRRVIALYQQGVRWYDKNIITDIFWVQMRINGDAVYVFINGVGRMYFEFQTTGYPVVLNGGFYKASTIGVTLQLSNGRITAAPEYMGGKRVDHCSDVSLIQREQQVQILDEPVHYPGPEHKFTHGYPRALYESWAPCTSHTGVHKHGFHLESLAWYYFGRHISYPPHATRDVNFDIPYQDGNKLDPVRLAYLRDNGDWPRAMGIQVVQPPPVSTWEPREFAIYIDAFDQVCVFPTGSIEPLAGLDGFGDPLQNVPSTVVTFARVSFPGWVYIKSTTFESDYAANAPDTGLSRFPEYEWKVSPDGKFMCAVVYGSSAATFDSTYYAPFATTIPGVSGPNMFYPDSTSFNAFNASACGVDPALNSHGVFLGDQRYIYATGLLEVEITITLTGPNPEDYTLSLNTTVVRDPNTTPYCTLLAGYVWHDVKSKYYTKDNPIYDARRGDLCVLDAEFYGDIKTGDKGDQLSLKNLDNNNGAQIRQFDVVLASNVTLFPVNPVFNGTFYPAMGSILAYDFCTLSFAFKRVVYDKPIIGTGPHYRETYHPCVSIYVMNKFQRNLYPDTIDFDAQTALDQFAKWDEDDQMKIYSGNKVLMPLNDLRAWGDADMDSLRETYTRDASLFGTYTPPINSFFATDVETVGHKYWKTTRSTPTTSSAMMNWFRFCAAWPNTPFPIFDCTTPAPGWYMYQTALIHRIQACPYTTFFAHPNGTWAFFDQQFIYNRNGEIIDGNIVARQTPDGAAGLDPDNIEHVIFDWVHFQAKLGSVTLKKETSFVELYDHAIQNANNASKNFDDAQVIGNKDILKATFTTDTRADTQQTAPVPTPPTYARLWADWQGYTCVFVDRSYFDGTKTDDGYFGNWEYQHTGGLQDLSFGAYWWKDSGESTLAIPQTENQPVTFSSCVLITF